MHGLDDPTRHGGGGGSRLREALPLPLPRAEEAGPPVRVTVVGADVRGRHRLIELLARTPGVQVVGWADSVQALALLGISSDTCLSVEPGAVGRPAGDVGEREPVPAAQPVDPLLSPRQRQVLAAYGAGNELLEVVARRLGMGPETLKTHLRRIRAKYDSAGRPAPTRRDLYVRALEDGVLFPPA